VQYASLQFAAGTGLGLGLGMYPAVAGKIVSHGPYTTVADLYKIEGLTSAQSEVIKKYENRLVAKTPSPDYVIDRINNGLYR